jgi:enoyl-CoA hydratase/3-hydroxyacyl-CoA dehydrogenase
LEPEKIKKIAILGAGVMGHGIAQVAAIAGYNVALRDIEQEFLDKAEAGIKKSLTRSVERGRISQDVMDSTLSNISMTLDLSEAVIDAQLVIEAVPEVMRIKHIVWKEVNQKASKNAVFATNTSSLSISEIAQVVDNPERFIGMHFFNPPAIMKLVEVNSGEKTKQHTVYTVQKIAEKMGKTPVWVKKDSPGFIVNRVLITYLNEAAKLLDKFSKEQIDAAMQFSAKMPLGPFMLSDLIGLDIVYHILKEFEDKLGPYYSPDQNIISLYDSNKLGRKTGEGFYSYKERPYISADKPIGLDTSKLLKSMISEADKLVTDNVADKESIDLALKLGANIPKGPFELKEEMK